MQIQNKIYIDGQQFPNIVLRLLIIVNIKIQLEFKNMCDVFLTCGQPKS